MNNEILKDYFAAFKKTHNKVYLMRLIQLINKNKIKGLNNEILCRIL